MNEKDFEKIESMIYRHVGTFADSIQHKLDLVVLAADLKAHRRDTEAHPFLYKVKEGGE